MKKEPTSSCAKAWGMCMRDHRCHDTACPGHPALTCSTCKGGPCPTPMDCQLPEPTPAPRPKTFRTNFGIDGPFIPKTREGWGRFVGGVLGLACAAFVTGAVGHHLGIW